NRATTSIRPIFAAPGRSCSHRTTQRMLSWLTKASPRSNLSRMPAATLDFPEPLLPRTITSRVSSVPTITRVTLREQRYLQMPATPLGSAGLCSETPNVHDVHACGLGCLYAFGRV